MRNWLIIICSLTFFFGCATVRTDFAPLDIDLISAKSNGDIQLTTGDLDRPYRELGVLFVKGHHARYETIMEKLQSKAKELGANAIIKIEFGNRYGHSHRLYCRGVAVVYE